MLKIIAGEAVAKIDVEEQYFAYIESRNTGKGEAQFIFDIVENMFDYISLWAAHPAIEHICQKRGWSKTSGSGWEWICQR